RVWDKEPAVSYPLKLATGEVLQVLFDRSAVFRTERVQHATAAWGFRQSRCSVAVMRIVSESVHTSTSARCLQCSDYGDGSFVFSGQATIGGRFHVVVVCRVRRPAVLTICHIDELNWLERQHARAPIYTVSHYVAYLRRFVADTEGSRSGSGKSTKSGRDDQNSRPADGIHPLSYFLRKLMLDLKVSYDSFVRDFVRAPNDGLSLLLRLLANLQNAESSKGKSSGSLNHSTSRLDDYKRSITDEHDCLLCIKYSLRVQNAISQLANDADGLQRIAGGAMGTNSKARVTCLEYGESVRFKILVNMLHTRGPSQVLFQVTSLKLFNTLLNSCPSANQRVYLQQELISAGLDLQFLSECAQGDGLEYDDLKREIHEWKTRYIDVDLLLRRLKSEQRESLGGFFSGPDGPLQVSSRRPSVRSIPGAPHFGQDGTSDARLGQGSRRDFATSNRIISHGGFVSSWQPYSTDRGHQPGGEVNGSGVLDLDDESDIISVSRQQTPHMHRKYTTAHDSHPPGRSTGVHMALTVSAHDVSKPPAYQRNGFHNGYADSPTPRGSTVDAYGLVVHRQDSRGGGYPQRGTTAEGMYSNWKLHYFSTPTIRTPDDDDEGDTGGENRGGPAAREYPPMTNSKTDAYDSGVYIPGDDRPNRDVQGTIWQSGYYPFSKRALYRGHDTRNMDKRDATLQIREINPRTMSPHAHSDDDGVSKKNFLTTPDPDYSPLNTPRGSMRSLTTEVARVLQDFEKTLHAHDSSRPPSALEVGPVAFV
ncbi:hypothetical protein BaRGS_00032004, partial [Batillaria attramentaria]